MPGVSITIADNGMGMDSAIMRRIFEPFFTTKEEVGTGLGMWVTQGIVEKHQGLLRMRSRTQPPGRGTVFTLFLPLKAGQVAEVAA